MLKTKKLRLTSGFYFGGTGGSGGVSRRGSAQGVPYDLILWYVSKIIYLSKEWEQFSVKSSNLFIDLIVRTFVVRCQNIL